ncbi:FAD dependent oxidoreductase [Cordyceps fumosorosea ARSEF 2679]|uniref:FAD dependent oxidoreductase n=1 Tax=Cordyceps fumosorosea (strain ARSEF 2679) TaxID=1081104 RepID=A0A168E7H4_CORFA|nr:FAD dependent oxidoreductase [Cordyceps fumosorosea ARSEF 2679]OAA73465.1 FAD dependent oxidoreductase [Cordyceps fumosorosea ARSEF 2679]
MTSRPPPGKDEAILIVGGGVFGLSTALELATRGYTDLTVFDRFAPPAPDGSSVDLSRIVRFDYGDRLYGAMAREAVAGWAAEYPAHYHQCGFLMLNEARPGAAGDEYFAYTKQCVAVDEELGRTIELYDDAASLCARLPCVPARLDGFRAFYNPRGGWADAAASIAQARRARQLRVRAAGRLRAADRRGGRGAARHAGHDQRQHGRLRVPAHAGDRRAQGGAPRLRLRDGRDGGRRPRAGARDVVPAQGRGQRAQLVRARGRAGGAATGPARLGA